MGENIDRLATDLTDFFAAIHFPEKALFSSFVPSLEDRKCIGWWGRWFPHGFARGTHSESSRNEAIQVEVGVESGC